MKKTLPEILASFTSRKFLAAAAAEVGLLVAMFAPEYGDQVTEAIVRLGTIVGMVAVAIGYVVVEGKNDRIAIDGDTARAQKAVLDGMIEIDEAKLRAKKNS